MLDQNQPLLRFSLLSPLFQETMVLRYDPIGWEDLGSELHRDKKYHGIATEYTAELGFIKDGKSYLSQAYDAAGIEAEVVLLVQVYDPNAFVWQEYNRWQLDFTNRSETATEFRCQAEKTGFTQLFLSREDSTINLLGTESVGGMALPALQPTFVELHSKAIRKRYEAITPADKVPALPDYMIEGESRAKTMYFGFGGVKQDDFGIQETNTGTVTVPENIANPEVAFYTTKERGQFEIEFNILCDLQIARRDGEGDFDKVDIDIFFRINNEAGTRLFTLRDVNVGGTYNRFLIAYHKISRFIDIKDRIYLYGVLYVHDISGPLIGPYRFTITMKLREGSFFRMEADTQTAPTQAAGLLAYEAMNRVCQAATDSTTAFRSDFFGRTDTVPAYPVDGPGSLQLVTGGFQVRGFPLPSDKVEVPTGQADPRKSLYATWKGLFDAEAAAYWLGVGIERLPDGQEVVRVEPASYFYSSEVVLELEETVQDMLPDADGTLTTNLVLKELADRYYITAKAGWQKWSTQETNGLDEFNASREWALPLTRAEGTYDAVGNYITAGFYIESTRRQRYDATSTTDDRADNDNFLICLLRSPSGGFITERNQEFAEVSGVFSPSTVYNARLSPARMLRRHGPAIAAGLRYQQRGRVRFSFGEGNNAVRTRLHSETQAIEEGADFLVSELGTPLWQPHGWSFTAPCTIEQAAKVLAKPRGRIRFRDQRGQTQEGWILDFKHTLSRSLADFTLLRCHALTDL
ncbi:hypothetical protein [Hymenobacter sp. YC55]|uniref:hypothetical protein n=1 Tax=Hymenobacter sp. YC55 TaxID=3034019 RepID=UPI0023F95350|nr:hypothetical protein [Hymenobacter sp. YC55]MDF7810697.1 hypothetical protein [Hymenobacter sp. YC55]